MQESGEASKQEVIYLSHDIKKLLKELQPFAETMNLLAEACQNGDSKPPSASDKQSEQAIKITEAVKLMAGMISTYHSYQQKSKNDQQTISRQRKILQEAIYAESDSLKLGKIDLSKFERMQLHEIEKDLVATVSFEHASNYLARRDKNFKDFKACQESLQKQITRSYQLGQQFSEKIEATAKQSEATSKLYENKIKLHQKRLRYAGRRLNAVQVMRAGSSLFSLYDPALGTAISGWI